MRLLIIDDDADDIEIFQEVIEDINSSFRCDSARDAKDAWEKLLKRLPLLPDLIFLDLNMPQVNGKVFLEKLKTSKEFSKVPVIIYSTSSFQKDVDEVKLLGAAQFLTKSSNYTQLREVLTVILKQFNRRQLIY